MRMRDLIRVNRYMLQLPPDAEFTIKLLPISENVSRALKAPDPPEEILYTDGACIGNGTDKCVASWAVLALKNPSISCSGLVKDVKPSNQTAEITSALMALKVAKEQRLKRVMLITDSKYVVDSINKWLEKWMLNGFKDSRGMPVDNEFSLRKLHEVRQGIDLSCSFTRGHADDPYNIEVDLRAKEVLERNILKCGTIVGLTEIDQTDDEEVREITSNLQSNPLLYRRFHIVDGKLYLSTTKSLYSCAIDCLYLLNIESFSCP